MGGLHFHPPQVFAQQVHVFHHDVQRRDAGGLLVKQVFHILLRRRAKLHMRQPGIDPPRCAGTALQVFDIAVNFVGRHIAAPDSAGVRAAQQQMVEAAPTQRDLVGPQRHAAGQVVGAGFGVGAGVSAGVRSGVGAGGVPVARSGSVVAGRVRRVGGVGGVGHVGCRLGQARNHGLPGGGIHLVHMHIGKHTGRPGRGAEAPSCKPSAMAPRSTLGVAPAISRT